MEQLFKETGGNPVRARRREVQLFLLSLLPKAAISGQVIGEI